MKIGLVQLNSIDDLTINLNGMLKLIEQAKAHQPDLLIFPENSLYFRLDANGKVKALATNDKVFGELQKISNETKIAFHITTAIDDQAKVFNASVFIQPDHQPKIVYRKIHLFDISLTDQKPIRESDSFVHGSEPTIFEFKGFKFGSSICYDIRFAELYSFYAKKQVDAIVVPAAFLVKTGMAHWEVLLRARAIESQCYILAPAQSGHHVNPTTGAKRETYGNTVAVDPWGQVLVKKADEVGVIYVEIAKSEIDIVRKQIPMQNHRRL